MVYINTYNESSGQYFTFIAAVSICSDFAAQENKVCHCFHCSMQRSRGKQQNGKTRKLFKKIRDTKGNFHEKTGTIKDKNDMDLTETEDIKKRW